MYVCLLATSNTRRFFFLASLGVRAATIVKVPKKYNHYGKKKKKGKIPTFRSVAQSLLLREPTAR